MLQNIRGIYGNKLAALDGDIGSVKDFYFDDKIWVIRYLVADTGSWLSGRLVLISPHAFAKLDHYENALHLKLHKMQIQNSPSIEWHKPVSRQFEEQYYRYYGWPAYWNGGAMWGLGGYPMVRPPPIDPLAHPTPRTRSDQHLRSSLAIAGYEIQAVDGPMGRVTGLMVDDKSWAVRSLSVETGHWYSGKEIFIPTDRVNRISFEDSRVYVGLTKADIQATERNELTQAHPEQQGAEKFSD